ncbi:acetone carboxylase subunit gamma [Halomarina halobia]|uniref:Acetone carboxylase subunit gamma n=1 Tax=Halomarina halobia TaxID=3033386 RepID=A0ABD6ADV3_9EURY|nr:acetone carboxylase subunit gamma [Halomarina sp. PSR21]
MKIHEYLELDAQAATISCSECGEVLCDADQNYKEHSSMRTGPVTDAGPLFQPPERVLGSDPGYEFREWFCPGCGVLFDHRFALEGDRIIHDIEIDVEALES